MRSEKEMQERIQSETTSRPEGRHGAHVAYLGVMLALALILSYVEMLIPFFFGVPGMKLGLTNVLVVFLLIILVTILLVSFGFMVKVTGSIGLAGENGATVAFILQLLKHGTSGPGSITFLGFPL